MPRSLTQLIKLSFHRQTVKGLISLAILNLLCWGAVAARAADDCAGFSFNSAPSYSAGQSPVAVAVGDFNGDGKSDLAVANILADSFSIMMGDGSGAFGPPKTFPVGIKGTTVGAYPRGVATGDLNNDGALDLVVVGGYSHSWVSIVMGDGAGNFGAPTNINLQTTGQLVDVVIGDFNGDGKKDIVTTDLGVAKVFFLLGNGAGAFAAPVSVGVNGARRLALGDFNRDNLTDVAVTGAGSEGFTYKTFIIPGNSSGSFSISNSVTLKFGALSLAAGDFNHDGKDDLAAAISFSSPAHGVAVYLGDGAGGFGAANEIFTGYDPTSVVADDFSGDGTDDLAVAVSGANNVAILTANGAGDFSPPQYYGAGTGPIALASGDFNGDSKLDLVAVNSDGNAVSILLGQGGGAFKTTRTFLDGGARLVAADFNGDNRPDLAIAHGGFQVIPTLQISLNDGAGGLLPITNYPAANQPTAIAAGDFNRDNKMDVVLGLNTGKVAVYPGNGAGSFGAPIISNQPYNASRVGVGDFNNDGNLDLVLTPSNASNQNLFVVMLGNGSGSLGAPTTFDAGVSVGPLAMADFNNDGKVDVATGFFGSVAILPGNGTGGFDTTPYAKAQPGQLISNLTAADLNNDGRMDLVTANGNFSHSITITLNNGSGFDAPKTITGLSNPGAVAVADFNLNGTPDIAVGVTNSRGSIAVLAGDGLGNFSPPAFFTAGGSPQEIAVADFNGDGKPDMGVGGTPTTSPNTTILLNTHAAVPCLSISDATIAEGNAGTSNALFTVTLSAASAATVKVNYLTRDNTAKSGTDYQTTGERLVFAPGETTKTISVPVMGNTLDQVDRDFHVLLMSPENAAIGKGQGTGTITDDDPEPVVSIGDVSAIEGQFSSSSNFVFDVTLSAPSSKQISVKYSLADGTAQGGKDFYVSPTNNTVVFQPGTTSAKLYVLVNSDNVYEPTENFFVNLTSATNAVVGDGQGQGTIIDDDPIPSISVTPTFSFEENSGIILVNAFQVRLTNPSSQTVTVDYSTLDGTAVAGTDYNAATGTLTFAPEEVEKQLQVQIVGDTVDEIDETFSVKLSNPVNAILNTAQFQYIIFDDDGPEISINDISILEGQSGLTRADFTVSLSAPSVQDVTVRVATQAGSAVSGSDYQGLSNFQLRIPAGATTGTLSINVTGDTTIEPDETFSVILSNPLRATIADGQGAGTILNDDSSIQFSASTYSINEGAVNTPQGYGTLTVDVKRTGYTSAPSTVRFFTSDESGGNECNQVTTVASQRCDYSAAAGTLRFAAGESTKQIQIPIVSDGYIEGNETFKIKLQNPTGGSSLGTINEATITIEDRGVLTTPAENPYLSNEFFVRMNYVDFLGREPDAEGWNTWPTVLNNCGPEKGFLGAPLNCDRAHVSHGFFGSPEFTNTGFLIYRMYEVGMNRLPRYSEFTPDMASLSGFGLSDAVKQQNLSDYLQQFTGKTEFTNRFSNALLTTQAETLIEKLEQTAEITLPATAETNPGQPAQYGRQELINLRANGTFTVGQILKAFVEQQAVYDRYFTRAEVTMMYFAYLRRDPDLNDPTLAGWNEWVFVFTNGGAQRGRPDIGPRDIHHLIFGFIYSEEYRKRFGQP